MRPVMIRITPEMAAILERIAADLDWTLARVMRMLLADGLRAYMAKEAAESDEQATAEEESDNDQILDRV